MADQPKSRPEPERPPGGQPSVYGGQWGSSGKQKETEEKGKEDRPEPITTPKGPEGRQARP